MLPTISYSECTGCGGCAAMFPGLFEMRDGLPWLVNHESFTDEMAGPVQRCCPFGAIKVE